MRLRIGVCAAIAGLIAGCGNAAPTDCAALVGVVNKSAERIEETTATTTDPSGLKALADAVEKAGAEAEALKLGDPALRKQAKDYAAMTRDVAKVTREMAAAGEARDKTRADAAKEALEKAVAAEPLVLKEVNRICGAK